MFPFDQYVSTWFALLRFQLTIVALLAAAGTLLAVVGLYALIAYVVAVSHPRNRHPRGTR